MYIFSMQLFWSMHRADQSHLIPVEWQKGSTYDGQTLLCVVGSCSHCWLPCGGCEVTRWNWTLQLWSPLLPPGPVKRTKPGCATRHSSTEGKGSLQCGCPPLRTHSWTWHEGDWPRGITSEKGCQGTVTAQQAVRAFWGWRTELWEELNHWAKKESAVLSAAGAQSPLSPDRRGVAGGVTETSNTGNKCHWRLGVGKSSATCT